MAEPSKEAAKPHRHYRISRMTIGAIVIVALVAVWLYLSFSGGAVRISTSTMVTLTGSPSYFGIGAGTYSLSVARTAGGNFAYVYVDKLPIFMNPPLNVTLYQGNMTKINEGSAFADVGLTLESVSGNTITVRIVPLDPGLQIAPDTSKIHTVNNMLAANNGNSVATSSITTTAVTTVATTTTVVQTNTTHVNIMAALIKNRSYGLIKNYSILYDNTSNCTQGRYNTAYIMHYGYAPAGPNTYLNVSSFVPYSLYMNMTNLGKGNYSVAYSTKTVDPVFNNTPAVVFKVNVSTSTVSSVTFGGIFQGADYSSLFVGYNKALGIGGACGVAIP